MARSLEHLQTPSKEPWTTRQHPSKNDDPRDPFDRDRDRIVHCESFRRLQHKTQVFIVTESDLYRTRITHSIEVAQIGRSISKLLGLSESLTEAICLGHDVGHVPFGHIGEEKLGQLLDSDDIPEAQRGWNSNIHSLYVLDELEVQYPDHLGLNLTWATREGIARHKTRFDVPVEGFGTYASPSCEAQAANVADEIAYATHDLHDALEYGLIEKEAIPPTDVWLQSWNKADGEFRVAHPSGEWPGVDKERLLARRVHRHMIDYLVRDVLGESTKRGKRYKDLQEARKADDPIVTMSSEVADQVAQLLQFMFVEVYKSPLVARQNAKAAMLLDRLFNSLHDDTRLLPRDVQERIKAGKNPIAIEVAYFLASLTDRGAIDLYNELYAPSDRAMGHHVR